MSKENLDEELILKALKSLRSQHSGEMYTCVDCYRNNPCHWREVKYLIERLVEG